MKWFKILLLLLGFFVVVWLLLDTGIANIKQELYNLGPWGILFLLPYIAVYIFDTLGWKYSFCREIKTPFSLLFHIRLAGEAINYTTPTAYIGGEPVKAYILSKKGIPFTHGLASVVIGKFLMTVVEVIFILIGIEITVSTLGKRDSFFTWLIIFFLIFSVFLFFLLHFQKKGMGKFCVQWVRKIKFLSQAFSSDEAKIQEFDQILSKYYSKEKLSIALSCVYYFIGWCLGALEIYILLLLMGYEVTLPTAIALEAISVAIKGAGGFIPGSIGVQEGGQVWIFALFGYPKSLGLTFGILRRLREVFWILVGLAFLSKVWKKNTEMEEEK
ncbi:MAG: flippase-like domain-containing protein [Candidatus Brocadiae bacterium]|nr:flippase-like domain-containing protein [Candidatus Brocadiia bacterium]